MLLIYKNNISTFSNAKIKIPKYDNLYKNDYGCCYVSNKSLYISRPPLFFKIDLLVV
jgi:hypothetical protein